MSTKFNRKPPLAKSPIRTRPRTAVRSATSLSVQTPQGSMRKNAVQTGYRDAKKMGIKPQFDSVLCDLRALVEMVISKAETKGGKSGVRLSPVAANNSWLFERGRFYDLYSARRNERLRRRLGIEMEDEEMKRGCGKYDLGVAAGIIKRRGPKRLESGQKSLPADLRSHPSRYSLSSSKDNTRPLLSMSFDRSYGVDAGGKKTGSARRVGKI